MIWLIGYLVIGSWFFPWWTVGIAALLSTIAQPTKRSALSEFAISFALVFVFWLAIAFYLDLQADGMISHRLSSLFQLPQSYFLNLLSPMLGGLVAGFGSLVGFYFRVWREERR